MMNTNKKKLYTALIIYILSMAALLVSRLLDFFEIWFFIITSTVMIIFSLIFKPTGDKEETKKLEYRKDLMYSTLIFSAWLLLAIPLIVLGDYIASVSGLGYDLKILQGGIIDPVLWVATVSSAIAYELFFRGVIYSCFSNIFKKKVAMLITALGFAIFFLDIRLILAAFLLNISQTAIGVISKKYNLLLSVISAAMILVNLCVISGENAGGLYFGLSNIIGMLMIFSSISAGISYVIYKNYNDKKFLYIEIMVLVIVLVLLILVGSLIISI